MNNMIRLILPLPPSTNRIWRGAGQKVYKSADYNKFLEDVGWTCKEAQINKMAGCLSAEVTFFFKTKAGDADNRLKALFDSLQGYAYENDSQVTRCCYERKTDPKNPRVEIRLISIV